MQESLPHNTSKFTPQDPTVAFLLASAHSLLAASLVGFRDATSLTRSACKERVKITVTQLSKYIGNSCGKGNM